MIQLHPLVYFLFRFASILMKIVASVFIRDSGIYLTVFLSDFGIRVIITS